MTLSFQKLKTLVEGSRSSKPARVARKVPAVVVALEVTDSGFAASVVRAGVPAVSTNGSINTGHVTNAVEASWPAELDWLRDPQTAGDWLRKRLDAAGIAIRDSVLVVPRRDVTLRLLQLPDVDISELVSLVQLQAESRLSQPVDSLAIDFVPLPPIDHGQVGAHRQGDAQRQGDGHRQVDVVLLTAAAERIAALSALAVSAGLKPVAAVAGELATPTLSGASVPGLTLDVIADSDSIGLVLGALGRCVASMTVTVPESPGLTAKRIAASADRLIAALPPSLQSGSLTQLRVYSSGHADGLPAELADLVGCRVTPLSLPDSRASSLRALAAVTSLSDVSLTHDFLQPRQPVDHKAAFQRRAIRWAVAASLLCGFFGWWLYDENCSAANRITELREQERRLGELIDRGQPIIDMRSCVAEWQAGSIDWPRELVKFSEHLPESDRAYLTRLQLELEPGSGAPVIRAAGVARDQRDVTALSERLLATESRYELLPHGIEPNLQDQFYKSTFQIEAKLLKTGED